MKQNSVFFLFFVLLFLYGCNSNNNANNKTSIKILSGPKDGFYSQFLSEILDNIQKKDLTKQQKNIIEIYNTPGSVYNLELLSQGAANFALVQGDVISEIVLKNGFDIQGVSPLFHEDVFLFRLIQSNEKSKIVDIDKVSLKNISVPRHRSGAYMTAKRLFELVGVDILKMESRGNYEAIKGMVKNINAGIATNYLFSVQNMEHPIIKDILDGRLDGFFFEDSTKKLLWKSSNRNNKLVEFYKSIGIDILSKKRNLNTGYPVEFVSLPKRIIAPLKELFRVYSPKEIKIHMGNDNNVSFSTVSIRAFIIARSSESRENVEHLLSYLSNDDKFKTGIKTKTDRWPLPIHIGAYNFLSGEDLIAANKRGRLLRIMYAIIVFLLAIFVFVLIIPDRIVNVMWVGKPSKLFLALSIFSKRKGVVGISSLILIFVLAASFINSIEQIASKIYGYTSPFNSMSLGDVSLWLLLFITSGTEQGIFPSDPSSKFIVLFLDITVKYIAPAFIVVYLAQWFREITHKRYGLSKKEFFDHVIFVGWDKIYGNLLNELVRIRPNFKAVIATDYNENPIIESNLPVRNVGFVKIPAVDKNFIEETNFLHAQKVYVVTPNSSDIEVQHGIPISFINYINRLHKEEKIKRLPPIYILNSNEEIDEIYNHLELPVLKLPSIYNKLIPGLFSGGGFYSLINSWLGSLFLRVRKSTKNNLNLSMKELSLKRSMLNTLEREWHGATENSFTDQNKKSPFAELLDATSSLSFLEAYHRLDDFLETEGIRMIGICLKFKMEKNNKPACAYFSAPVLETMGKVVNFSVDEAILYLMNMGDK